MCNSKVLFVAAMGALMVAAMGCGSPQAPGPGAPAPGPAPAAKVAADVAAAREQLMAQWMELARSSSKDQPKIEEATGIAKRLADTDPASGTRFLDLMEDPASTPFTKILAAFSVRASLEDKMIPRLIAMTKPGKEATTRSCATQVLAGMANPEVDKALAELKNDPERRVRFHAMCGLASHNPVERKPLQDLWQAADTAPAEREAILQILATGPAFDSLAVFQSALTTTSLSPAGRLQAAQILGRVGDKSCIPALTECGEKDPDENVRKAAKDAVTSINSKPVQGGDGTSKLVFPAS